MKIMVVMLILTSTLFCFMSHPLSAGLVLLAQTILIALMSGMMNMNFWFSYIVFLIMIGGMLVLFTYMTSIASNEKFKFSPAITLIVAMMGTIMISAIFIESLPPALTMQVLETKSLMSLKDSSFFINKYMNYPHSMMYLVMVTYLLITLIAIVKITTKGKGTLRQNF